MEKVVEFGYVVGKGFVRVTVFGQSIDVLYSTWKHYIVRHNYASNRGSTGFITVPVNAFYDMMIASRNISGNDRRIWTIYTQLKLTHDIVAPIHRIEGQYEKVEQKEELKTYQEFSAIVNPLIPYCVRMGLNICELLEEDFMEEGLIEQKEKMWQDYKEGYISNITRQFIKRFRDDIFSIVDVVEEEPIVVEHKKVPAMPESLNV